MRITKLTGLAGLAGAALVASVAPALAQDAMGVPAESQFVFNTFSFLVSGALVMWMAAGFAMLESGLVRTKNTASICLKNIALYSIAGILYYIIGYNLMYVDVSGYMGSVSFLYNTSGAEAALLDGSEDPAVLEEGVEVVTSDGETVAFDGYLTDVFSKRASSRICWPRRASARRSPG